jgi:hypothetical protein
MRCSLIVVCLGLWAETACTAIDEHPNVAPSDAQVVPAPADAQTALAPETSTQPDNAAGSNAPPTKPAAAIDASTPGGTDRDAGSQPSAVDLCAMNHGGCHSLARCTTLANTRACACPEHYAGDGVGDRGCRRKLRSISASRHFTCALTEEGEVWCWGANDAAQLGDGTLIARPTPVRVQNLRDVVVLGHGISDHTCAVTQDGRIYCWGSNQNAGLGDGTTTRSSTPLRVGLSKATDVGQATGQGCAVMADGQVYCWGEVYAARAGASSQLPRLVEGVSGATQIAVGAYHACALGPNGRASCWGDNTFGQIGLGSIEPTSYAKAQLVTATTSSIRRLAGDLSGTCAILADDSGICWGHHSAAVADLGVKPVTSVSGGPGIMCAAVGPANALHCWPPGPPPLESSQPSTWEDPIEVSVGLDHICILLADSRVMCWGANQYGNLGDGSIESTDQPAGPVEVSPF